MGRASVGSVVKGLEGKGMMEVEGKSGRMEAIADESDSGKCERKESDFPPYFKPFRYGHFDSSPQCRLFRDEDYQPPQETRNITDEYDIDDPGVLEVLLHPKCPKCQAVSDTLNSQSTVEF